MLGVRIHAVSLPELLTIITNAIASQEQLTVTYANVHAMNAACDHDWFRAFLNEPHTLVFCDGFGVKWGARILGYTLPQRFTPPDWLNQLAATASQHQISLYLIGSRPGVAAQAADTLKNAHPSVSIVGTHHGYFPKTTGNPENDTVIQAINAAQPDILIVGFGTLLQEQWIKENRQFLDTHVILAVGAAFDYVSGEVMRGPRWMTDHGLEWLARLVVEPQRLWRRYLVGNPLFLWRIVKQRVQHK